jgi:hypothetical protein
VVKREVFDCLISLKQVKMKIEDIDLYEVATCGNMWQHWSGHVLNRFLCHSGLSAR